MSEDKVHDKKKVKTYLGDGVYAEVLFGYPSQLVLTTEDGFRTTNRIIFEPETWESLISFVEVWKEVR